MPIVTKLKELLNESQRKAGHPLNEQEVAAIVQQVLSNVPMHESRPQEYIFAELQQMAQTIQNARQEVAALRPDDIKNKDIPSATDELDAVIGATENATIEILNVCEELANLAEKLSPEGAEVLTNATTKIFEACSFQDITGQRISKVVNTLKSIEERVSKLLHAFGDEIKDIDVQKPEDKKGDTALLNGPQLPQAAANQADIDALFDSLGG